MSCTALYSPRVTQRCCQHQADIPGSESYLNQIPQICNNFFLFFPYASISNLVASKLFVIEGEHFYFVKTLVLCCVERRLWLLVALTTAPLGFVLFVARLQHGCFRFQGYGPKFWVLNDALDLHNVKSTNSRAQRVRRGTESVRVTGWMAVQGKTPWALGWE